MHSHTYSGNPLGCAAALSELKIFREQPILKNASKTARYLNSRLNEKLGNHKNIGEIRSIGLINAVLFIRQLLFLFTIIKSIFLPCHNTL